MSGEWPHKYTPAEVEAITKPLGVDKLSDCTIDRLQEAAEVYQWGSVGEKGAFSFLSRRRKLTRVAALCKKGAPLDVIQEELKELDAWTSQMLSGINMADRQSIQRTVAFVRRTMPRSGPEPRQARLQFIGELARIFELVTGQPPTRRVHDREYGPFLEFVKAALTPIDPWATQGVEADMQDVLYQRNKEAKEAKEATNTQTAIT